MAAVLVDSNVILDLLAENSIWTEWSDTALYEAGNRARLVINPLIYAEISIGFDSIEAVEATLQDRFDREALPYSAAFLAGKAYLTYRRRAGTKTAPLPDFFIGAHAAVMGYELLTRDPRRYRTYFPTLTLIAP